MTCSHLVTKESHWHLTTFLWHFLNPFSIDEYSQLSSIHLIARMPHVPAAGIQMRHNINIRDASRALHSRQNVWRLLWTVYMCTVQCTHSFALEYYGFPIHKWNCSTMLVRSTMEAKFHRNLKFGAHFRNSAINTFEFVPLVRSFDASPFVTFYVEYVHVFVYIFKIQRYPSGCSIIWALTTHCTKFNIEHHG